MKLANSRKYTLFMRRSVIPIGITLLTILLLASISILSEYQSRIGINGIPLAIITQNNRPSEDFQKLVGKNVLFDHQIILNQIKGIMDLDWIALIANLSNLWEKS